MEEFDKIMPQDPAESYELSRQADKAKLIERFNRHPDYYQKHVDADFDALAEKFLGKHRFMRHEAAAKDVDDDAIDHVEVEEEEFEQGSMFQPHFSDGKADASESTGESSGS